ncbi:hypothetical protein [Paenibacillus xylanilyticus]|uniref:Uncharacterized protein n=1 Tax=Paenibacillus xylanilyticus TaxID=248903 RepID=A0A7Y6BZG0_9BACL|nr:hypothetical protein [Paenibacillus xylanilyticus]NUU77371.1 hypothetical protein [Paenibacillus xylanilyticus]
MREEKVNDTYYVGYEGYLETLLDLMCHYESTDNGILQEHYAHEGWYEESPWEIQDLDSVQFYIYSEVGSFMWEVIRLNS